MGAAAVDTKAILQFVQNKACHNCVHSEWQHIPGNDKMVCLKVYQMTDTQQKVMAFEVSKLGYCFKHKKRLDIEDVQKLLSNSTPKK
jgi:hypothetical protein